MHGEGRRLWRNELGVILKFVYLLLFAVTILGGLWEDLQGKKSLWRTLPLVIADVYVFGLALGPPVLDFTPQFWGFFAIGFAIALNTLSFIQDVRELRDKNEEGWILNVAAVLSLLLVIPAFALALMNVYQKQ